MFWHFCITLVTFKSLFYSREFLKVASMEKLMALHFFYGSNVFITVDCLLAYYTTQFSCFAKLNFPSPGSTLSSVLLLFSSKFNFLQEVVWERSWHYFFFWSCRSLVDALPLEELSFDSLWFIIHRTNIF